jgi:hypothetical protein
VAKYENPPTVKKLIEKVELIKPHFSQKQIQTGFEELVGFNILRHQPPPDLTER